jgi:hypothetical protein
MIALLRVHELGALEPGLNLIGEAERELGLELKPGTLTQSHKNPGSARDFPLADPVDFNKTPCFLELNAVSLNQPSKRFIRSSASRSS